MTARTGLLALAVTWTACGDDVVAPVDASRLPPTGSEASGAASSAAVSSASTATGVAPSGATSQGVGAGGAPSTSGGGDAAGGGSGDGSSGGAGVGGGGGGAPPVLEGAILVPPAGASLGTLRTRVVVTTTAPVGSRVDLLDELGDVVDGIDVTTEGEAVELGLGLVRGRQTFTVVVASPDGRDLTLTRDVHGGRRVATTIDATVAIDELGGLVRWGGGDAGPTVVGAGPFTSVSASTFATVVVDEGGDVAQLGDGDLAWLAGAGDVFVGAAGGAHVLALRTDGRVLAAGDNAFGQLGLGDLEDRASFVEIPGLVDVVAIAASTTASFAVTAGGLVFVWGDNSDGLLGSGNEDGSPHPVPAAVPILFDVVDVAAGRDHVLVLRRDGVVLAWGEGSSGQIGNGTSGFLGGSTQPVSLGAPDGVDGLAVAAGANGSGVVGVDGSVLVWGQNSLAQLGLGDTAQRTTPTVAPLASVTSFALGPVGGAALASGAPHVWGSNEGGRLGLPVPPDGPSSSPLPRELSWE